MNNRTNDDNILHIGFDDTDSKLGRCTTHLAFKIVSYIKHLEVKFIDYPLLIRLNPNIPWKTRGNGAICIRLNVRKSKDIDRIIEHTRNEIEKNSEIGNGANPGLVFFQGKEIPHEIRKFNRMAMFDILSREKALKIIEKDNNFKYFIFGNGRGIVGATAAIGDLLTLDHTFEIIMYRNIENCQNPRYIDPEKVINLHNITHPATFNSYDFTHNRVLITPHGPDPVFCGIRGEDPETLLRSLKILNIEEKLDGYMIYRSNQGTGMHLQNELKFARIKTYVSGYSICKIVSNPYTMQGGHVFFKVEDDLKNICLAAVYEPTGLTKIASQLHIGDLIKIGFGVRKATPKHQKVLNIEYIWILELAKIYDIVNPLCVKCRKRMKSEGKDKGYQCRICKNVDKSVYKKLILKQRTIEEKLYIPTPKAHRHLTKPIHRYEMGSMKKWSGFESNEIHSEWFEKFSN